MEALAPRKVAVTQAAISRSKHPIASSFEAADILAPEDASAPLSARSESEPTSHGDGLLLESNPRALALIHRPPPPVFFKRQRNISFHVEKLLQKRRRHGHN